MMKAFSLVALLALSLTSTAQSPVPRVGNTCPASTLKSGEYCVPQQQPDGSKPSYIVKSGNRCPGGYNASGDYCRKATPDSPQSIPRAGKDCPGGWNKSGEYCLKASR